MGQTSIKELFEDILSQQLALGYDLRPHLNPPATDEQFERAEKEIGFTLNDELKAIYRIANGTNTVLMRKSAIRK